MKAMVGGMFGRCRRTSGAAEWATMTEEAKMATEKRTRRKLNRIV